MPANSAELLQLRSAGIHRNPGGAAAVSYPAGQFEFVRQPEDFGLKPTPCTRPWIKVPRCSLLSVPSPSPAPAKVALPVYRVCYALPAQFNLWVPVTLRALCSQPGHCNLVVHPHQSCRPPLKNGASGSDAATLAEKFFVKIHRAANPSMPQQNHIRVFQKPADIYKVCHCRPSRKLAAV